MVSQFSLFQSHIDLAHDYWKRLLKSGDIAIDATCGNGHDTLVLAQTILISPQGKLFALDIQQTAITNTQQLLANHLSPQQYSQVTFRLGCHSHFPPEISDNTVSLVVYNLGYLPKGNKRTTTIKKTTLQSIEKALKLIRPGGMISITCYLGHQAGKEEEQALLHFSANLEPSQWSCCHHQWINRTKAPSLLLIQKRKIV